MLILILILIVVVLLFAIVYISISITRGYKESFNKDEKLVKPNRVVVSFTTLPSRTDNLKKVINSILSNTITPDIIYINIPDFCKKENKEYIIDDSIKNCEKVIINKCEDYGPITKLYPTLLKETDPETIIICIDDDKEYDPNLIEHLLFASQKYPENCVCISGWNYIDINFFALPLVFSSINGVVKEVDVLQCYNGVLYKRKFFQDDFIDYVNLKKCKSTDDIMISKYLQNKNIEILSIPFDFKNKSINMNFFSSLGITNLLGNNWIKCVKEKI